MQRVLHCALQHALQSMLQWVLRRWMCLLTAIVTKFESWCPQHFLSIVIAVAFQIPPQKKKSLNKDKATLYHSTFWPERISAMGWLRLVGSLKLYVSFAEYRLFSRALLQKRPIIIRSLLIIATPYDRTPLVFWNCYCVFKSPQRIKKKK